MPRATKPPKVMRKIVTDPGVCTKGKHRQSVTSCPHCNYTPDEAYQWWIENGHTLVLAEVWGKHAAAPVITECPGCFESSWVHWDLTTFGHMNVPESWKKATSAEHERRHLAAVRTWSKGICQNCTHLKRVELKTVAWKECAGKSFSSSGGPAVAVGKDPLKNQCPHFQQVPS